MLPGKLGAQAGTAPYEAPYLNFPFGPSIPII